MILILGRKPLTLCRMLEAFACSTEPKLSGTKQEQRKIRENIRFYSSVEILCARVTILRHIRPPPSPSPTFSMCSIGVLQMEEYQALYLLRLWRKGDLEPLALAASCPVGLSFHTEVMLVGRWIGGIWGRGM